MMEMKIKIDVPELVAAVEKLAAAIDKTRKFDTSVLKKSL